ncbi:MAG TPA: hypothetical protein VG826_03125 [Pirellulales bacterium]|nr:hypothetical protein [Pirellulales bacterium]
MSLDLTQSAILTSSGVDEQNPWPGLLAFTEDLRGFFYGRDEEADELLRRVDRRTLTVLFGQSGLGKSSLVQAGLFPRLRAARYLPVAIRLDHTASLGLSDQVMAAVSKAAADAGGRCLLADTDGEPTLWERFHRADTAMQDQEGRPLRLVLVFDQFEELFAIGQVDEQRRFRTAQFLTELADLIENRAPAAIEKQLDKEPDRAREFVFDDRDYRVLVCLREDYLPHLESLRSQLPSVSENRMRLTHMKGGKALQAVLKPGAGLISPDVAHQLVWFVAGKPAQSDSGPRVNEQLEGVDVEPSLLSLMCRELNDARLKKGLPRITSELLAGSREQILQDFYERCVADQPEGVRSFIEEELVTESGFRENIHIDSAYKALQERRVPTTAINALVKLRLLHVEDRGVGRRVELIHDLLTPVIKRSREERRQLEAAQKMHKARLERRRLRRIVGVMWVALLLVGAVAAYAILETVEVSKQRKRAEDQGQIAEQQRKIADEQRVLAEQRQKSAEDKESEAIRSAEEAKRQARLLLEEKQRYFNTFGFFFVRAFEVFALEPTTAMKAILVWGLDEQEAKNPVRLEGYVWARARGANYPGEGFAPLLESLKEEVENGRDLAEAQPGNANNQRDLASWSELCGVVALELGSAETAIRYFEGALDIHRRLAESGPTDTRMQLNLAALHRWLGNAKLRLGRPEDAVEDYRQCVKICGSITEQKPNPDVELASALSHYNVARAQRQTFNYAAAAQECETALQLLHQSNEAPAEGGRVLAWRRVLFDGHRSQDQREWASELIRRELKLCNDAASAMSGLGQAEASNTNLQPALLYVRCAEAARRGAEGDRKVVTDAARELQVQAATAPEYFYDAARGFSLGIRMMETPAQGGVFLEGAKPRELTPDEQLERETYRGLALAALEHAIHAGFRNFAEVRREQDFVPLRSLPQFQGLLDSISPKGRGKPR